MKKVNFFKVMSAFVAFSAMTLASCTDEKMTITSPTVDIPAFVLPDAKATVSVTVYDVESKTNLGVTSVDATANIGSELTVECPAYEGYIVAQPISVAIPSLVAGQVAIVPVTFYVASEASAEAAILAQMTEENLKSTATDAVKESKVVENESDKVLHSTFKGTALTGREFVSVAAAESRAAATGAEFIEGIFGEETFGTETQELFKYWLNPWHQATVSYEQAMSTDVYTVEFNGATFDVTFTKAGEIAVFTMSDIKVIEEYKHNWEHVLLHGHAGHDYHGHGHGSENAGGGIVDAE